jgi:hypothetical protein
MTSERPTRTAWDSRQPWRGLFIFLVSLLFSFGLASLWKPDVIQGTPFAFAVCLVPNFIVMGLFWRGWPAAKTDQPARGIVLLLLAAVFALAVFMWTRTLVGGGSVSPITSYFGITVVTLAVIMSPLLEFWPFAGRLSPAFAGMWWLIVIYALGVILFRILYNFGSMSTAPWYNPALDPHGIFEASGPLTVVVMGLPFAFAFLHLGLWPLSRFKQPWRGLAACALVWGLSGLMYVLTTSLLGLDVIEAQVKFGVYGVFGMMILQMMFAPWPGRSLRQPLNGLVKIVLGLVLSTGMFYLIRGFGLWLFPGSPALQGDGLYQWMAIVALGLCFPFFAMYTTLFQSWPLPVLPEKED